MAIRMFLLCSCLFWSRDGFAQAIEMEKLLGDGGNSNGFGFSGDHYRDLAAVGEWHDNCRGTNSGRAAILRRNELQDRWELEASLCPSEIGPNDEFGHEVAVGVDSVGEFIVVGAPRDDTRGTDAGAVYVFRNLGGNPNTGGIPNWVQQQKILDGDGTAGDSFGQSVAASRDASGPGFFIVGAPDDNTIVQGGANKAGSAVVFQATGASGWTEDMTLYASDAAADDEFGLGVSISEDLVYVGAWQRDNHGTGKAYVFRRIAPQTWQNEGPFLVGHDTVAEDRFGLSGAVLKDPVRGDRLIIGATFHDTVGVQDSGAAYVFHRQGGSWVEEAKLVAPNPRNDDRLGSCDIAFDSNSNSNGFVAVVGAWRTDGPLGASNTGAAYVYRYLPSTGLWTTDETLLPSDRNTEEYFGYFVSVDRGQILAGSSGDDNAGGNNAGAAYGFTASEINLTIYTRDRCQILVSDTIAMSASYGTTGSRVALVLTSINGQSSFNPVLVSSYGADHRFNIQAVNVPGGLAGLDLGFKAFEVGLENRLVSSNEVILQFR